ncbi:phosphopyruvate hydratase [Rhinocladiella mackenziei CBS 650.93]|uniref:Enolase n=1 Tax=Rhinocladiella mackenziei CBS 650.93 TaxID=1442369 RepID=A0A0D2HDC8_9EURO|nr:phosphopyruvate hydratase [Rhinocladiella mackenziei CBS 650.93]KIX08488.1 phosphopyruvate hydratase [Rhinocladiella mackenziei CBS 650.93]
MSKYISSVRAAQRLDSRGKPTVQVHITTPSGTFSALVPSGASKGDYEAVELRDGDKTFFQGNGVAKAVHNVEQVLGPALMKENFNPATDLKKIDEFMCRLDGSDDKGNLGANAILGISMACARAGAAAKGIPLYEFLAIEADLDTSTFILPVPFFNVLNGGVHSGNRMAFQEFMIAPVGASSTAHAVQMGAEVYSHLKTTIVQHFGPSAVGIGDEGGFAPPISEPHEALDLLVSAISSAGYTDKIKIGIDPASSEFFISDKDRYNLGMKWERDSLLARDDMAGLYRTLLRKYPIVLLEDPFAQDDWPSWTAFNKDCGDQVELVGDDLLATNVKRINLAHDKRACNALLLKINQIGTISEAIAAAKRAYELGWHVFVSHRSGETTDDFIADLTVALGTGHLKSGSPCRGERVAKYNRLMDIEDEIQEREREGKKAVYAGEQFQTEGREKARS